MSSQPCSSRNQPGKLKQQSMLTTMRGISRASSISHSVISSRVRPASSCTLIAALRRASRSPPRYASAARPHRSAPTSQSQSAAAPLPYSLFTTHYSLLSSTSTSSMSLPAQSRNTAQTARDENPAATSRRMIFAVSFCRCSRSPLGCFSRLRSMYWRASATSSTSSYCFVTASFTSERRDALLHQALLHAPLAELLVLLAQPREVGREPLRRSGIRAPSASRSPSRHPRGPFSSAETRSASRRRRSRSLFIFAPSDFTA